MKPEQDILLEVLGVILAFALAARIGWLVFLALRNGVARITRRREFPREKKLLAFWTIVGVQCGFVVLLLAVGAKHLARLL